MLIETKLYQGKEIISFDEEKHQYFDNKGNRLIGVTTITGVIDKSRPLIYWAVGLTLDYLRDKWLGNKKTPVITEEDFVIAGKQHTIRKEEAATTGDIIHQWVSDWIKGKKPEMPEDEKVVNGITAFLKFQKEHKVKWLESEKIVFSKKNQYCGILDAIGKIGKELVLVDFKSSNAIYQEMEAQVAGYAIAYEEETGKKFDRQIIIKFGKIDGNFEIKEISNTDDNKKAFLSCLTLKRWLNSNGK